MTGQNLIDSLTNPPPTTEPKASETPGEEAVREGLSHRAGVLRWLGWKAVKSVARNLETEDTAFGAFCNGGKQPPSSEAGGPDEMRIEAAGNVTVYQQPTPRESSGDQSALQPLKAGAGWFSKAIMAASLACGAGGLGYIINDLLGPDAPAAVDSDTDTDTITVLDFPTEEP